MFSPESAEPVAWSGGVFHCCPGFVDVPARTLAERLAVYCTGIQDVNSLPRSQRW